MYGTWLHLLSRDVLGHTDVCLGVGKAKDVGTEKLLERPRLIDFLPYPSNYGSIPKTLVDSEDAGDGDSVDVLVLGEALARGQDIHALARERRLAGAGRGGDAQGTGTWAASSSPRAMGEGPSAPSRRSRRWLVTAGSTA